MKGGHEMESYCLDCGGTGWQDVPGDPTKAVRRCACWRAQRATAPGVPRWADRARLATYPDSPLNLCILTELAEWLESTPPRPDVYLHGPTGTGKTTLLCALLNELAGRRVSTAFVDVREYIQHHLDAIRRDRHETAYTLEERLRTVDVLGLDDVAKGEKGSEYSRGLLTALLDARLAQGRTTIWTSNLSLAGLHEFFGDDRLPSRITGACGNGIYEFRGPDHRHGAGRLRLFRKGAHA